ncbi:MAG: hypothetical protein WC332_03005 [Clostridia bacterium]|jgi:hypothetical protein
MAEATSFQFLFGQLRNAENSLSGGTAYFYAIGGTTPKAAYTDIAATASIYSIVLDADGSAEVYGIGQYRVVVKDSDDVTQYDKDVNLNAGSSYVTAPATNTANYIPQWNGVNSGTLKDGLLLVTSVGATGDDTSIPTEQAVREAITGIVSAATTSSAGTVEVATNAEALAGTDASRSISPASLDYVIDNTPHVLQVVNYSSGALDSTTNTIPYDDSIPQSSEGKEWGTLAITPKRNDSKLIIDVVLQVSRAGTGDTPRTVTIGLFQDSSAAASAASSVWCDRSDQTNPIVMKYWMTSGTTDATTFKVRYGANTGGANVNGVETGSRKLGGVSSSSITITEVYVA